MLPQTKTKVVTNLEGESWLFYGPPKIGKSTLASEFPGDVLFLTTEDAHRHLSIYKRPIADWSDFQRAVKEIKQSKQRFTTVVVDTLGNLFTQCREDVCSKRQIEHPADEEWSKGWDILLHQFMLGLIQLFQLECGIILIAHEKKVEVKMRGIKLDKTMPALPTTCMRAILPLVDIIGYCGFSKEDPTERRVIFEPCETLYAGDRTGRLPASVPLLKPPHTFEPLRDAWRQKPVKRVMKRAQRITKTSEKEK